MNQRSKGEISALLTILTAALIVVGVAAGTRLVEVGTRIRPQAQQSWDWGAAASACQSGNTFPQCGGQNLGACICCQISRTYGATEAGFCAPGGTINSATGQLCLRNPWDNNWGCWGSAPPPPPTQPPGGPPPTVPPGGGNCTLDPQFQLPDVGDTCAACLIDDFKYNQFVSWGHAACTRRQMANHWCNGGLGQQAANDCALDKNNACLSACTSQPLTQPPPPPPPPGGTITIPPPAGNGIIGGTISVNYTNKTDFDDLKLTLEIESAGVFRFYRESASFYPNITSSGVTIPYSFPNLAKNTNYRVSATAYKNSVAVDFATATTCSGTKTDDSGGTVGRLIYCKLTADGTSSFTITVPPSQPQYQCYSNYNTCINTNCPSQLCATSTYCPQGQYRCVIGTQPPAGGGVNTCEQPAGRPDRQCMRISALFCASNYYGVDNSGQCPLATQVCCRTTPQQLSQCEIARGTCVYTQDCLAMSYNANLSSSCKNTYKDGRDFCCVPAKFTAMSGSVTINGTRGESIIVYIYDTKGSIVSQINVKSDNTWVYDKAVEGNSYKITATMYVGDYPITSLLTDPIRAPASNINLTIDNSGGTGGAGAQTGGGLNVASINQVYAQLIACYQAETCNAQMISARISKLPRTPGELFKFWTCEAPCELPAGI